jgi:glyoxylase-like metal-dependent hydrolase (beta-lactamase superfamily II)
MLEILSFTLGLASTNVYLVADTETDDAVVIDPAWSGGRIREAAENRGWQIKALWLTHAHFDHFGGAAGVVDGFDPPPPVALHDADLPLWEAKGGASLFGVDLSDPGPKPSIHLTDGQILPLGGYQFEVRHAPGHTPGHVLFYCAGENLLFSGDVIFRRSIGRADLPGGDHATLIDSIRQQVLTLPDETRILSGHGPETTVGEERRENPFLVGEK